MRSIKELTCFILNWLHLECSRDFRVPSFWHSRWLTQIKLQQKAKKDPWLSKKIGECVNRKYLNASTSSYANLWVVVLPTNLRIKKVESLCTNLYHQKTSSEGYIMTISTKHSFDSRPCESKGSGEMWSVLLSYYIQSMDFTKLCWKSAGRKNKRVFVLWIMENLKNKEFFKPLKAL